MKEAGITGKPINLLSKVSGSLSIQVAGAGIALLLHLLLARLLNADQYGVYVYAYTWVASLALITKLGMQTSFVRFTAGYRLENAWAELKGLLIFGNGLVLAGSIAAIGIVFAVIWLLGSVVRTEYVQPLMLAFIALPLLSLMGLMQGALQGLKLYFRAQTPDMILRPVMMGVLLILWYFFQGRSVTAVQAVVMLLAAMTMALMIGWYWLAAGMPGEIRHCEAQWQAKKWLAVSLPLMFVGGMHLIVQNIDLIMIGIFLEPKQVGIYAISARLAGLVAFGFSAASVIVAPLITEHLRLEEKPALQHLMQKAAWWIFLFTLAVSLSIGLFGKYLLALFGADFVQGYIPLLLLLLGQVVNAIVGPAGLVMTMSHYQKEAGKILMFAALFNAISNLIMIKLIGIVGAALSTAVTTALWNIWMLRFIHRNVGIDTTIFGRTWRYQGG